MSEKTKIFDIRPRDKVLVRPLNEKDWEKVYKFISKYHSRAALDKFKDITNSDNKVLEKLDLTIESVNFTPETKTQYVIFSVTFPNQEYFHSVMQARYLKIYYRKSAHKLTNLFSSFWEPKKV